MLARYVAIGILPCVFGVAGCSTSSEQPQSAPSALSSSSQLRSDTEIHGAYIYRAPNLDASRYRRLLIEPVVVYNGPEANFESFSEDDKRRFAGFVSDEFRAVLTEKLQIATAPAPDVVRVRVTLLGVKGTVGGVATATRILPIGMAVNAVRGVSGAGGSMTGGIELAIEVSDAQTNELLVSAVRQEAPAVFDIESTLSTNDTVRASARGAAETLRDGIVRRAPQMARR
jgi:hypothetical protein